MSQLTLEQAFQLALAHHQAGRLREAESLYRQIIALQPANPEALAKLALLLAHAGSLQEALTLLRQAITLAPHHFAYHLNLGALLQTLGQSDHAITALRQALALHPHSPEALYNLGLAYTAKNQLDPAFDAFQQALNLKPNYPEALNNLGNIHKEKKRLDQAIACFRQAIALKPNFPQAHVNLGNTLVDQNQLDQAFASYQQALALNPNNSEAHNSLGVLLQRRQQFPEALNSYHRALELNPNSLEALFNLGSAHRDLGQLDEALASYQKATSLAPNFAPAHLNRGEILLLQGHFKQGWDEYEWRWQCKVFHSPFPHFPQPIYHHQDPAGKTILLHTEQGLGDSIQFARYAPLLADRGAKVILHCHPELHQLFETLPGITAIHDHHTPLPPFDLQASLMSLPRSFDTNLSNIPHQVPYLQAAPQKISHWKNHLAAQTRKNPPRLKIGLVWAGRPTHLHDLRRSISLSAFAPLFNLPHAWFISLQKGPAAQQIAETNFPILDPAAQLQNLTDTAALLCSLDLLITVDTAVAHLAGALALPVWTLISYVPDWRWLQHRIDSPWYPTMRLFRQTTLNDWTSVIEAVTQALMDKSPPTPT